MARLNTVKHSRQARICRVCNGDISIGETYNWVHPRYMRRVDAHTTCVIPVSMTSNSKMVAIWSAQEEYAKLTDPMDKKADAEMMAEAIREVAGEYSEAASNQQEYFPDSEVAQENEDKGNELESWADEIEAKAGEVEEAEEPEEDDEVIQARARLQELENELFAETVTKEDYARQIEELNTTINLRLEELGDESESDTDELDDLVQACPV